MKQFIQDKNTLYNLIFYFIFSVISIVSIILAEYNNNLTPTLFLKQLVFYVLGIFIIYLVQKIDITNTEKISLVFYLFSVGLLIILLFAPESIAPTINGAKGWFNFRLFTIQPSEFTKLATVMLLSALISEENFKKNNDMLKLAKIFLILILPFILILKENDLGNALFFIFLFLALVFLVSKNRKLVIKIYFSFVVILAFIVLAALYFPRLLTLMGLKSYHVSRILSWINPTEYTLDFSYQITLVLNEIKKGGLSGTFAKNKTYIDEQFNDFIFSVIAKNFGFIGAVLFLIIFIIFILKLFSLARKCNPGNFSYYFIILAVFELSFSFFINIFSSLAIIPVIGISLPFISYGGSSLIANSILYGLIFNINNTINNEFLEDSYEYEDDDNYINY